MGRISGIFFAMAGLAAAGTSTSVMADNLLGVYVGAGVGEAQIGNNNNYYYNPYETAPERFTPRSRIGAKISCTV